jgi:tetratricopeptide (TPR) repeat protein
MKRFAVILALLLALSGAQAQTPDDQYISIYSLIQEAGKLNSDGRPGEALPKYLEAQTALQRFQKGYPEWNPKVISFRLHDVAAKIAEVSPRVPAAANSAAGGAATNRAAPPTAGPPQAAKSAPSDWETQRAGLADQVRQLQADKAVLQAKLKESLAVQPATMDPRKLAQAEEKIRNLQKEIDLFQVSLAQEKLKALSAPDTNAVAQDRQALAEANRKLAEQTEAAKALALEKQALRADAEVAATLRAENKLLKKQLANRNDTNAVAQSRQALAEANRKLAEQTATAKALALEKLALRADAEAAAALRAENKLLKKQLANLNAAPPSKAKAEEPSRQLARARAQIAALQSDKELLQLEKAALEDRVKRSSALAVAAAAEPKPAKAAEASRIRQLEQERDALKKQLTAANKVLQSRKGKATEARLADLEHQLATQRARLDVYEARQMPYTAEELALFKKPETKPAEVDHTAARKSVKELPPGTVALVAEANRYYANKQLDKAEEGYLQVLRQDNKNVPTLANLAAIQLALDHLDAAETNIQQAVTIAPDDPYSLFVLGHLRFRQKKYDEATDALSRAAKLDPKDAQIQNLLGLALSEKGLRVPAETAMRKAIQLDPGYADAHNNLAVAYITQQPPLVELARWHYQKALAAGQPHNLELEKMLAAKKPADSGQ